MTIFSRGIFKESTGVHSFSRMCKQPLFSHYIQNEKIYFSSISPLRLYILLDTLFWSIQLRFSNWPRVVCVPLPTCANILLFILAIGTPAYQHFDRAYFVAMLLGQNLSDGLDEPWNRTNVALGEKEERRLMTGAHVVADIHCNVCDSVLGWKYVSEDQHLWNLIRQFLFSIPTQPFELQSFFCFLSYVADKDERLKTLRLIFLLCSFCLGLGGSVWGGAEIQREHVLSGKFENSICLLKDWVHVLHTIWIEVRRVSKTDVVTWDVLTDFVHVHVKWAMMTRGWIQEKAKIVKGTGWTWQAEHERRETVQTGRQAELCKQDSGEDHMWKRCDFEISKNSHVRNEINVHSSIVDLTRVNSDTTSAI